MAGTGACTVPMVALAMGKSGRVALRQMTRKSRHVSAKVAVTLGIGKGRQREREKASSDCIDELMRI